MNDDQKYNKSFQDVLDYYTQEILDSVRKHKVLSDDSCMLNLELQSILCSSHIYMTRWENKISVIFNNEEEAAQEGYLTLANGSICFLLKTLSSQQKDINRKIAIIHDLEDIRYKREETILWMKQNSSYDKESFEKFRTQLYSDKKYGCSGC